MWKRFKGGKQGTLWYYRQVVKILRARGPEYLVAELDRVVTELEDATKQAKDK